VIMGRPFWLDVVGRKVTIEPDLLRAADDAT